MIVYLIPYDIPELYSILDARYLRRKSSLYIS